MKKVFYSLLAFAFILGISCKMESELSVPKPDDKLTGIELDFSNKPSNAASVRIDRTHSTGESNICLITLDSSFLATNDKFIDCFVEPNVSYNYSITYSDSSSNQIGDPVLKTELVSKEGLGELAISKDTPISYDETTGKMVFSLSKPLSEVLYYNDGKIIKNPTINIDTCYWDGTWIISGDIEKNQNTIDWPLTYSDFDMFDHPFKLSSVEQNIYFGPNNNSMYMYRVNGATNIKNILSNLPETITVPNLFKPTITTTNEGIKINVHDFSNEPKFKNYQIVREEFDSTKNDYGSQKTIIEVTNPKCTEVIDYFVKPNTKYRYRVNFEFTDIIYNSKESPEVEITSTAGLGTPTLDTTTEEVIAYDETTGIMTFPNCFGLKEIKAAFDKVTSDNKSFDCTVSYGNSYRNIKALLNTETSSIDWVKEIKKLDLTQYDQNNIIENTLYKRNVDLNVKINDAIYILSNPEASKLPTVIKIPDYRDEVKAVQDESGIRFIFDIIPIGAKTIQIERINANSSERFNISANCKALKRNFIVDYLVTPGTEYTYKVNFRDDNWNLIKSLKTRKIKATSGIGELNFETKPVATYDEEKATMTFTTLPKLNPFIEKLLDNESYKNIRLTYCPKDENGKLDWNKQAYFCIANTVKLDEKNITSANVYNKDLSLAECHFNSDYEDIRFSQELKQDDYPDIPNTIKITKN